MEYADGHKFHYFGRTTLCSLVFASAPCFSAFVDANWLRNDLLAQERIDRGNPRPNDYQDAAHGIGYVMGVIDALEGVAVCLPIGVTGQQPIAMVKKYLDDHPDSWNLHANVVIASAIRAKFPCKK